ERRLEIGDRIMLAALRLVDVAAVVVGERVDRIERDSRGVIVDRARQVSGPAVGEAAPIEGARAVWIEPDRLREVGDRRRQSALSSGPYAGAAMISEHARSLTSEFRPWLQSASVSATAPLAAALTTRHASPILFIILAPLKIVVPRRGSESHVRHWWHLGHAI